MHQLLSTADVADLLGVSPRTVTRLRDSGELRPVRVRGLVRFDPVDVVAFIKKQRGEK
jgi:excisionase family DNA binding protein